MLDWSILGADAKDSRLHYIFEGGYPHSYSYFYNLINIRRTAMKERAKN